VRGVGAVGAATASPLVASMSRQTSRASRRKPHLVCRHQNDRMSHASVKSMDSGYTKWRLVWISRDGGAGVPVVWPVVLRVASAI
jgi:hypothetical protein